MKPYTYDSQLAFLKSETEDAQRRGLGTRLLLLLSVAESIKVAQDHALNCAVAHKL